MSCPEPHQRGRDGDQQALGARCRIAAGGLSHLGDGVGIATAAQRRMAAGRLSCFARNGRHRGPARPGASTGRCGVVVARGRQLPGRHCGRAEQGASRPEARSAHRDGRSGAVRGKGATTDSAAALATASRPQHRPAMQRSPWPPATQSRQPSHRRWDCDLRCQSPWSRAPAAVTSCPAGGVVASIVRRDTGEQAPLIHQGRESIAGDRFNQVVGR